MFTVKFVTEATSESDERIELHTCDQVRVFSQPDPEDPPGTACKAGALKPPDRSTIYVELVDEQRRPFHQARIEHGRWGWNVAYVLNERGKTVQTIVSNVPG